MTTTFRFRAPGMAFDSVGTIIGARGTRVLIEGRGADAGKYFVKGMRGVQAFDSKKKADKFFASDAPEYKPPKEKPWDRPGDPPREAKDQGPGISVHGAAERGRDPHENPYVEYDIPDTRAGKDEADPAIQKRYEELFMKFMSHPKVDGDVQEARRMAKEALAKEQRKRK